MLSATFDDWEGGANYDAFSVDLTRSRAIFRDPEILCIIGRTCCTSQGDPDSSFPSGSEVRKRHSDVRKRHSDVKKRHSDVRKSHSDRLGLVGKVWLKTQIKGLSKVRYIGTFNCLHSQTLIVYSPLVVNVVIEGWNKYDVVKAVSL